MADPRTPPDEIAEMDAELRALMGRQRTRAPRALRDRVLKAVQDAEADEAPSEPEPRLAVVSEAVAPRASNWRLFAGVAVVIASVVGVAHKLARYNELRHADEASGLARVERARASEELAKRESRAMRPDYDPRYTFYDALPAGAAALPAIAGAEVEYVPSCEDLVTVHLEPEPPATTPDDRDLRRVMPDELPMKISINGTAAERSAVALKRGPFEYQFSLASFEPAACGVVQRYSIQLDLSRIGIEATPAHFEFTFEEPITTTVRLRALQ